MLPRLKEASGEPRLNTPQNNYRKYFNMFKIEKDVKIPKETVRASLLPFDTMEIGDSFIFAAKIKPNVSSASHTYGKKHDVSFTVRNVRETIINEATGEKVPAARCWRIK